MFCPCSDCNIKVLLVDIVKHLMLVHPNRNPAAMMSLRQVNPAEIANDGNNNDEGANRERAQRNNPTQNAAANARGPARNGSPEPPRAHWQPYPIFGQQIRIEEDGEDAVSGFELRTNRGHTEDAW